MEHIGLVESAIGDSVLSDVVSVERRSADYGCVRLFLQQERYEAVADVPEGFDELIKVIGVGAAGVIVGHTVIQEYDIIAPERDFLFGLGVPSGAGDIFFGDAAFSGEYSLIQIPVHFLVFDHEDFHVALLR